MASLRGGIVRDQNSANYNGGSLGENTNAMKLLKKGGNAGRKPLGDLSNVRKSSNNLASKKQNPDVFTLISDDIGGSSKISTDKVTKKTTAKPSDKPTSRRALSDISNGKKPVVTEAAKKAVKVGFLAEEPNDLGTIAEEQFLHNHQDCVKMNAGAMDMDHFLEILGLNKDSRYKLASPRLSPLSGRSKREKNLSSVWEYEEMAELETPLKCEQPSNLGSPFPPSCLKSPDSRALRKDQDIVNFVMKH